MRKQIRWISAFAAAVAAVVAIVVVTSSAVGTDDPGGELTVFKTGTPTTLSSGLLDNLRSSGIDVAANDAVSVQAPDGGGDLWILAQNADDVCLVRRGDGGDPITCGTTTALRHGAVIGFTPDEAAAASFGLPERLGDGPTGKLVKPDDAPAKLAGSVTFQGIAANDVTDAAAVTADGRVLAHDAVENNLFALPNVPLGEATDIRLTHTSGQDTLQPLSLK